MDTYRAVAIGSRAYVYGLTREASTGLNGGIWAAKGPRPLGLLWHPPHMYYATLQIVGTIFMIKVGLLRMSSSWYVRPRSLLFTCLPHMCITI